LLDLLLHIAVFAIVVAPAFAQCQPPEPARFTLSNAVKLALKQNPQHVIAAIRVTESERDRQAARAALLPHAGISASQFVSSHNLQTVERIEQATPSGRFQVLQGAAGFSQGLLDFVLIRRYQIGREGRLESERQRSACGELHRQPSKSRKFELSREVREAVWM
jgi:outer membrane protein TolC